MKTPLVFNRLAGRGRLAERLRLAADKHDIRPVPSADPAETRRLVAELAADHPRVIVAGGDGTLHHALRGLDGSDAILGLVPIGTGNDFASALGIPAELDAAIARAVGAPGTPVDLGRAGQTRFGGIAGIGIVADVLTYLDAFTRRFRGNWVYPWAVLRTVLRYRALEVRLESEEGHYAGPAMIAAAANAPRFGGGMCVAPEASMHDGLLDVVVLTGTSRLALIRLLPRVYRGTHLSDPACTVFRSPEVRITSGTSAVVHADGEAMPEDTGTGTVFRVDANAIRVAV